MLWFLVCSAYGYSSKVGGHLLFELSPTVVSALT